MSTKRTYGERLKDPRWQKRRLEILERDEWACQTCFDTEETLHVHHRYYLPGRDPWDVPDEALVVLCEHCHGSEYENRTVVEDRLLRALRERFFWHELRDIACGFEELQLPHTPDVVATAIGQTLATPSLVGGIVDWYLGQFTEDDEESPGA